MFEPFWKEFGDNATVVILEFANEALRLHRIVNNAVTDGRHLIINMGSTQLVHAIGVSKDSQVRAAKIPKVISDGYKFPHPRVSANSFTMVGD